MEQEVKRVNRIFKFKMKIIIMIFIYRFNLQTSLDTRFIVFVEYSNYVCLKVVIIIFCIVCDETSSPERDICDGYLTKERGESSSSAVLLPYFHKTVHSDPVLFHSENMQCEMRIVSFQLLVAHKCNEDHCVDL